MNTLEDITGNLADMRLIMIGIGVILFISICFTIYNMVTIYNTKNSSEDTHNQHLMSIAMNKHNLKLIKTYVEEEDFDLLQQIQSNNSNVDNLQDLIDTNKSNIESNKSTIESNKSSFNSSIDTLKSDINKNKTDITSAKNDIVLNDTKIDGLTTEFDTYKISQADAISTIINKQDQIQSNIGTFKYSDFADLTTQVGNNNVMLNNVNNALVTNRGLIDSNLSKIEMNQLRLDNVEEEVGNIDFVDQTELNQYFENTILPLTNKNEQDIRDVNTRITTMEATHVTKQHLEDNYLTVGDIAGTYATLSEIEDNYMTSVNAESTFAKLTDLDNYVTSSIAESTFAKLTDLDNYVTSSIAESTFARQTELDNYMKTTDIQSTYQTKEDSVKMTDIEKQFASLTELNNYMPTEDIEVRFSQLEEKTPIGVITEEM